MVLCKQCYHTNIDYFSTSKPSLPQWPLECHIFPQQSHSLNACNAPPVLSYLLNNAKCTQLCWLWNSTLVTIHVALLYGAVLDAQWELANAMWHTLGQSMDWIYERSVMHETVWPIRVRMAGQFLLLLLIYCHQQNKYTAKYESNTQNYKTNTENNLPRWAWGSKSNIITVVHGPAAPYLGKYKFEIYIYI